MPSILSILFVVAFQCLGFALPQEEAMPLKKMTPCPSAPSFENGFILVPDDYPTIQAAIDAAQHGCIVLVMPGTYYERIDFKGKSIVVRSDRDGQWATHDPVPAMTIINANQLGSCVTFENNEGRMSVLNGFTLIQGQTGVFCKGASPSIKNNHIESNENNNFYEGGGIFCRSGGSPLIKGNRIQNNYGQAGGAIGIFTSSPVIVDNIITGNTAEMDGGAISILSNSTYNTAFPEIRNNTFIDNKAVQQKGGGICIGEFTAPVITENLFSNNFANFYGGAIYLSSTPTAVAEAKITHNTISGNTAYKGSGICIENYASPLVAYNTITENITDSNGDGGGIHVEEFSNPFIHDNIIAYNLAGGEGGGIHVRDDCAPVISSNYIINNTAAAGGGLFIFTYSSAIVCNNIITGNIAPQWGGGIYVGVCMPSITNNTITQNSAGWEGGGIRVYKCSPPITNCIFWNNDAPDFNEIALYEAWPVVSFCDVEGGYSGFGNLDVDPLFVSPALYDYHLTSDSPCIDKGHNYAPDIPALDFEGDPRIVDGSAALSLNADMGADEFVP